MPEHSGSTDQIKKVELSSSIQSVIWMSPAAAAGSRVGIEVLTEYVGKNSEIEIEISDKSGKKFEVIKDKISGNHLWKEITVPEKAKDELYGEVKLSGHGLTKKSGPLIVYPQIEIKNLKWDKKEARRGDILKLTAEVVNAYEGIDGEIRIWEYDADGAHDLITMFPVIVKDKKIEAEWEFEYHEDTDDIPSEEETEKGYNPPEYFFRVDISGASADSDLLQFKDWIEIALKDEEGNPVPNEKYILTLPDGTQKSGTLDAQGYSKEENIPPGKTSIEFPDSDYVA